MSEPKHLGIMHASAVALEGRAVLIIGAAGRGKSSLALQLMGLGATLVADDRTALSTQDDRLFASSPQSIRGLIEARGIGILHAEAIDIAEVVVAVDLDHTESLRLPEPRGKTVFGQVLSCLHAVETPAFPAAILQYLKAGPKDPS